MTSRRKIALLRLATLVVLCLPAAEIAWRCYFDELGPMPVAQATLATGDWAVIFLLLSLALTPARGVFAWMPLIHIRRRIGVAAALYALLHFGMFILDQNGRLIVVAQEIAKRFYLTIGFAALLILTVLAIISTDGWQRRLKRNWKRVNLLVYPAAVLALVHFFLQSKINIGEATFPAFSPGSSCGGRFRPSGARRTSACCCWPSPPRWQPSASNLRGTGYSRTPILCASSPATSILGWRRDRLTRYCWRRLQ